LNVLFGCSDCLELNWMKLEKDSIYFKLGSRHFVTSTGE